MIYISHLLGEQVIHFSEKLDCAIKSFTLGERGKW